MGIRKHRAGSLLLLPWCFPMNVPSSVQAMGSAQPLDWLPDDPSLYLEMSKTAIHDTILVGCSHRFRSFLAVCRRNSLALHFLHGIQCRAGFSAPMPNPRSQPPPIENRKERSALSQHPRKQRWPMVTMANGHRTAASHPWHDLFIGERPCKAPNRAVLAVTRCQGGTGHVCISKTALFQSLPARVSRRSVRGTTCLPK